MKIIDNINKETMFRDFEVGDVFMYNDYIGMKTESTNDIDGDIINAVNMKNGNFLIMFGTEVVTPVEATLTLTKKG